MAKYKFRKGQRVISYNGHRGKIIRKPNETYSGGYVVLTDIVDEYGARKSFSCLEEDLSPES